MSTNEHWYFLAEIERMQQDGFSEREIGDFVRRSLVASAGREPFCQKTVAE